MWPFRKLPVAQPVEAPQPEAKPMRVSVSALERNGAPWGPPRFSTRAQVFAPARPAPGVVPPGMAMDDAATQSALTWASGGAFGEGIGFLGYAYLAELTQRAEYRRIAETLSKEMTRKWIKIKSTGDEDKSERVKQIEAAMKRFGIQQVFGKLAEHDAFFGIGHLYIDTGANDDPAELQTILLRDPRKVSKGSIKGFRAIEPLWCYPDRYNSNDPLSRDYYRPSSWFVQGKLVHSSRLLTFVSRHVPDILKPAYQFGGLSLSQMAKPYIDNWLRTRQSVSDLLHSFSVNGVLTDLTGVLNGGDGSDIVARAALFNATRDNRGLMLLDKDREEFFNVSAPLGTLDALQAQSQEQMASVSGIPLVKLLGITPSGLNASSDGEIRSFYDWIKAQQEMLFRPNLEHVFDLLQLNEFGDIDPEITFEFVNLWQLDEVAQANVEKTKADTHQVYIDTGVVDTTTVRRSLAADDASPYHGIELDPEDEPVVDPATEQLDD